MSVNYGSKRSVVGAHYGIRDWLVQRVTAALMFVFTVVVLAQLIFSQGDIGYELWAGIFSATWMKFLTYALIVSIIWHVWVGIRDVWMDYIPAAGLRLLMQIFTLVWLIGCAGWALQIVWRL